MPIQLCFFRGRMAWTCPGTLACNHASGGKPVELDQLVQFIFEDGVHEDLYRDAPR
jgi:hypothetical protein